MNKQLTLQTLKEKLSTALEHNKGVNKIKRDRYAAYSVELSLAYFQGWKCRIAVDERGIYFYGDRRSTGKTCDEMFHLSFPYDYLANRLNGDKPYINYYTTQCQSQYQLDRLVKLGKFAELVKDTSFVEDITRKISTIHNDPTLKAMNEYEIKSEIRKLISEIEEEEFNKLLKVGVIYKGEPKKIREPIRRYTSTIVQLSIVKIKRVNVDIEFIVSNNGYVHHISVKRSALLNILKDLGLIVKEEAR